MSRPTVALMRLPGHDPKVALPAPTTAGAAGADIRANFTEEERESGRVIPPGGRSLVPTGLAMAIPEGFEGQVRPRSGLALHQGLTIANAPGTIDSDYRGPIGVILINLGAEAVTISHGDRIAQVVIAPVAGADYAEVTELDETVRGASGFGSTGISE